MGQFRPTATAPFTIPLAPDPELDYALSSGARSRVTSGPRYGGAAAPRYTETNGTYRPGNGA